VGEPATEMICVIGEGWWRARERTEKRYIPLDMLTERDREK